MTSKDSLTEGKVIQSKVHPDMKIAITMSDKPEPVAICIGLILEGHAFSLPVTISLEDWPAVCDAVEELRQKLEIL